MNKGTSLTSTNSPMHSGDTLVSSLGQCTISFEDGNLAVWGAQGVGIGNPIWQSNTGHHPAAICTMTGGGDLEIKDGTTLLYQSNTGHHIKCGLVAEDSGHAIIYCQPNVELWDNGVLVGAKPQMLIRTARETLQQADKQLAQLQEALDAEERHRPPASQSYIGELGTTQPAREERKKHSAK